MIYKAGTSQKPGSLNRKEKRGQTANVWGERTAFCLSNTKAVWFSFNLALSKDAPLYLCSPFSSSSVFFSPAQKHTLGCSLTALHPLLFIIQLSVQLSWWFTSTDHSSEKHRGEKTTEKKPGCLAPSFSRVGEWRTVLYMEAAASPAREADLDTLLMEAFAPMWCKTASGKWRAMADRSIMILDSPLKTSHTEKGFSQRALSHHLEALWRH